MKKKISSYFSMRLFFPFFIMVELLLVVSISSGVIELLHLWFDFTQKVPNVIWHVIICAMLGSIATKFLVKFFFNPISKLSNAMSQVAKGNFSIRLEEDKGFKEVRQINRDFNLMTTELGATEILQTDFVSNVSHEFKTPINAIEGYATLLQGSDAQISAEQAAYIDKILFNTRRLSSLVGNILLLSKVDNQGIPDKKTTYRLDEQIRQSIVALEPRWMEKETELDVELERIDYKGNEALLLHVWNNLIENAIKFGPQQGRVSIRLQRQEEKIVFSVADEGPGIGADAEKHIFDRFYQSDSSHKEEGNGLGLALVKQIMKVVNGTISVENIPAGGCCFTVELFNKS